MKLQYCFYFIFFQQPGAGYNSRTLIEVSLTRDCGSTGFSLGVNDGKSGLPRIKSAECEPTVGTSVFTGCAGLISITQRNNNNISSDRRWYCIKSCVGRDYVKVVLHWLLDIHETVTTNLIITVSG